MLDPENKQNNELENENEENTSISQNESELNSDELIIELDDSQIKQDETIVDEVQNESALPSEDETNDLEEETPVVPENSIKSKKALHTKHSKALKKPRVTSKKKAKKIIIPFILVCILIGGGYVYMYTMQQAMLVSWFPFLETSGYIQIEKPEVVEQTEILESETALPVESKVNSEDETISEETDEDVNQIESAEEYVSEEEVVEEITEALVSQPQKHVSVQNIQQFDTPAWIISYASVSKNTNAIASVKKLRDLGNSAGYYWMPDYAEGAPQMYKVYIGPFASKAQAEAHITSIQNLEPNAYVLYVEGK